jgi:hypothetical protein
MRLAEIDALKARLKLVLYSRWRFALVRKAVKTHTAFIGKVRALAGLVTCASCPQILWASLWITDSAVKLSMA